MPAKTRFEARILKELRGTLDEKDRLKAQAQATPGSQCKAEY